MKIAIFGLTLGLISMGMLVYYQDWQTALAVFIFGWSMNISNNYKGEIESE